MIPDEPDIVDHMPMLEDIASRAGFVIELGCGDGNGSLRALTSGMRRGVERYRLYISVDLRDDRPRYDVPDEPWWHMVHGDSAAPETLEAAQLIALGRKADVIFIDTAHTYQQMYAELRLWSALAYEGTTWLFHDTWMGGEYNPMTSAIKGFAAENGWRYDDSIRNNNGIGVMRRAS